MNIKLITSHLAVKKTRQQRKLEAVKYILDKNENCAHLDKLAQYLLLPDSYLISMPATLLASIIEQICTFLANNKTTLALKQLALPQNECLLLLNCPNTTYLIDSILALQDKLEIRFQLLAHPTLSIQRHGNIITYLDNNSDTENQEILLILRPEPVSNQDLSLLEEALKNVVQFTRQWDQSHMELRHKLGHIGHLIESEIICEFSDWLKTVFIPFSYQSIPITKDQDLKSVAMATEGMELNISSRPEAWEQLVKMLARETDVIVQSLPIISPIIRCENLIYIGFRQLLENGTFLEHGFMGLFDEQQLNGPACKVPALCKKVTQTLANLKIPRNSYDFMQLQELFNLFPKIELFVMHETQLLLLAQSLRHYLLRFNSIKLLFLASTSPFRISALIIIPQSLLREDIAQTLLRALCQELSCQEESSRVIYTGGHHTGLQLSLIPEKKDNLIDVDCIERLLNRTARPWQLKFRSLLERSLDKERRGPLWSKYQNAFSIDYQALMSPRIAIRDMQQIERLLKTGKAQISLIKPCRRLADYRLHFYSEQEYFLDKYIPVLENMSLHLVDQVQFNLHIENRNIHIKSFVIRASSEQMKPLGQLKPQLLEAIQAILENRAENDPLNALITLTGLAWKEVDVLRAYRNYYLQLGYQSTIASIHQALTGNPHVATSLYGYFEARFRPDSNWTDPSQREEQALFPIRLQLLEKIEQVTDINADRILRTLFNLIDSTVRSNFHVRRNLDNYFFSFKINSLGIIDIPAPRPKNEIYVHAVDMEGIHLRGGKISRGGIRWSDRQDDFRTEILGLMQTQMSKNALIVPRGAKGGFVVKSTQANENFRDAGKRAYITLMHGLLDLTDNYIDEKVIKLPGIVAYDDNDPYLVVAADKGTAQFPDIANAIAAEYKFWLKDAFASGGSQGYNHKALGITARGAWESVKRHFREHGEDIQTTPFTVMGIGSMDGDVFGNGMLLSGSIKLLAAFSGQHIFIDPAPDPSSSFKERKRLFDLPGSSWNDYDRHLISPGGGVFNRNDKNIPLSIEVRKWLGIRFKSLDGESLIRFLLMAPVDLLWLGGIGTYVKASSEQHEDAGDRSNDAVRIDALDLRARVVGEGANLGFTQKARIEFSLAGGHINTDAVDNSAGVDISDHEVNLKILLFKLHKSGKITDYHKLFHEMTEEVCHLVLGNNYAQSLCLSLDQVRSQNYVDSFLQIAEHLESTGFLDRIVESFPQGKAVLSRPDQALTRPELAVLMAGCKLLLTHQLKEQHVFINADYCARYLKAYFPEKISKDYSNDLDGHPLASDIKATMISNLIINQAGCSLLALTQDLDTEKILAVISCYLSYDLILGGHSVRQRIYALDNLIEAASQYQLLLILENTLADFCRQALLRDEIIQPTAETIALYQRYLKEFEIFLTDADHIYHRQANLPRFEQKLENITDSLLRQITTISSLEDFPLLVKMTTESEHGFTELLAAFHDAVNHLELSPVFTQLADISVQDLWERRVQNGLQDSIKTLTGKLAINRLESTASSCEAYLNRPERKHLFDAYQKIHQEIKMTASPGLLPYITLEKALGNLLGC